MKVRIISAAVALPLLFLVLYFAPVWVLSIAIALISAIAAVEMLHISGLARDCFPAVAAGAVSAAAIPVLSYFVPEMPLSLPLVVFTAVIFVISFKNRDYMTHMRIFGCIFAGFVIPVFFSSIVRISAAPDGINFIILPFAVAWGSDTLAYFTGRLFGGRKLAPNISPNKTVSGGIGGIVGGAVGASVAALIMSYTASIAPHYPALILFGAVGSVFTQTGDLSMSFIKRNLGVKDFGNIMPGHGGVLDRFDSVLFIAPIVESIVLFAPHFLWS